MFSVGKGRRVEEKIGGGGGLINGGRCPSVCGKWNKWEGGQTLRTTLYTIN